MNVSSKVVNEVKKSQKKKKAFFFFFLNDLRPYFYYKAFSIMVSECQLFSSVVARN